MISDFEFIEVNGVGSVWFTDGTCRDVFVFGYLNVWDKWSFIVHRDSRNPNVITVSEASTGCLILTGFNSVQEALRCAKPFITEKKYYFATVVANALVKTKCFLKERNTTGMQTLAIDTALWM